MLLMSSYFRDSDPLEGVVHIDVQTGPMYTVEGEIDVFVRGLIRMEVPGAILSMDV